MLTMFLTAISVSDGKVPQYKTEELEILMKQRVTEDLLPTINAVPVESMLHFNQDTKAPLSTLGLIMQRVSDLDNSKRSSKQMKRNEYFHYYNIRTMWSKGSNLLYEPDPKTIAQLNDKLKSSNI
jgi:hypothetical protein